MGFSESIRRLSLKAAPKTQHLSFPPTFRQRRVTRPGDSKGSYRALGCRGLSRVDLFLKARWNSGPERSQYVAWHDLVQPVSENDGSRRVAARRSHRPDRVVGIERIVTLHEEFVFVDELVSGIRWDAKYATWDNFTGKPVDGYHRKSNCRLAGVVRGSGKGAREGSLPRLRLASMGWRIALNVPWIAFCAGRNSRKMAGRSVRHYPNIDRPEMFEKGYVAAKSGHSRGSTVDLTLYHLATGELAPMGGDHDLMDPISHHGAEGITQVEARNRQYLRSIMEDCGFGVIRLRVVALHTEARAVSRTPILIFPSYKRAHQGSRWVAQDRATPALG